MSQSRDLQPLLEELESKQLHECFKTHSLASYTEDYGHIISSRPLGLFTPRTIEHLQHFLPIASSLDIHVTCRGKGNSTYGQSQTDGIVIDLSSLGLPISFSENFTSVSVPVYKTWFDLIEYTKDKNMTVAVTIDNLDLTIGGTLSFGSIGGPSHHWGSGSDNVSSVDVVTMDGRLHRCSEFENQELFNAVLCGMGQFGIMIQATIPLVPAKKNVNHYKLSYRSSNIFLKDQIYLYEKKVFDHLKGYALKLDSEWGYIIEAVTYFDDKEEAKIAEELRNLSYFSKTVETMPYYEFVNMVTNFVKILRASDKENIPHPWYNIFMPENAIEDHIALALDTPHLTGTEPILIYPMDSSKFKRPLFMKPDCKTFFLLGVLYNTSMLATENYPFQEVLERNIELYRAAKIKGGCRYPIDSIPFTKNDWKGHYGDKWESVCYLKQKYDPKKLLGSGVMF